MGSNSDASAKEFAMRVSSVQQGLYAYILSLLPDAHDARDVLAETNLALWQKREEYDSERDFWPWACGFGKLQVLAFRKRQKRDRLLFSDDVVNLLSSEAESMASQSDEMIDALEGCLGEVDEHRRRLLHLRYTEEMSLRQVSVSTGRTVGAIADMLYRIRMQLAQCIQHKLAATEGHL